MPTLIEAQRKCAHIIHYLTPFTTKTLIVGSVRRGKPNPHDIEICCIPNMQQDLFDDLAPVPFDVAELGTVIKNGPRYKQVELPEGFNLDLFIVYPPAQWGVIVAIRTGPDTFSKRLVTPRRYGGYLPGTAKNDRGAVWNEGELMLMPHEADLFEFLELDWIEPGERS